MPGPITGRTGRRSNSRSPTTSRPENVARLYSNENFPLPVVEALCRLGYDVLTIQETGKGSQSIEDEKVLEFACDDDRILLALKVEDDVGETVGDCLEHALPFFRRAVGGDAVGNPAGGRHHCRGLLRDRGARDLRALLPDEGDGLNPCFAPPDRDQMLDYIPDEIQRGDRIERQ